MDRATIRELQAIREAEAAVQPHVGAVLGMDSVAAVYGTALMRLGRETHGVRDARALKIAFDAVKGSGAPRRAFAISEEQKQSRSERFPHGDRLR